MKRRPARLNKSALARELKISRPTLDTYLAKPGAPKTDAAKRYVVAAVKDFILQRCESAISTNEQDVDRLTWHERFKRAKALREERMLEYESTLYIRRELALEIISKLGNELNTLLRRLLLGDTPPHEAGKNEEQIFKSHHEILGACVEAMNNGRQNLKRAK